MNQIPYLIQLMKRGTPNQLHDIIELLEDYSNWLHKKGYIDADYYAEEPTAIDAYIKDKKLK